MEDPKVRKLFEEALEQFVENAKKDSQVQGIILFGSLAYDKVHERSNINVFVITKEGKTKTARLIEKGIPIDATIITLDNLRRRAHGSRGVFNHQLLSRSRLLYSRDGTLNDFFNSLNKEITGQDKYIMQINYHIYTLFDLEKAEKYLYVKNNLEHSFWFLIHALSELGYMLCYHKGIYPPREVILRGRELYPEYQELYDGLVNSEVTKEKLDETIRRTYTFMEQFDLEIYKPILEFISENDGIATLSDIDTHFAPKGLSFTELVHLHRRRILRRTMAPFHLTKKGLVEYSEPQYHFSYETFNPKEMIPTPVGPTEVAREIITKDYQEAVNRLAEKMKDDEYVLTLILAGSLAYDSVWEKSDIDAFIITRDDLQRNFRAMVENDVNIYAYANTRDGFRKGLIRATDGSMFHSAISKSKVIFTKDDTVYDLYEDIQNIGAKDLEDILFLNYIFARDLINKAEKALFVLDEPEYCVNFIMSGIRRLANIETLLNRKIPLREVVEQALEYNPEFFNTIYIEFIHNPEKSKDTLAFTINQMIDYLEERLDIIVKPIINYLQKEQEATHSELMEKFNDISLPIDLTDFIQTGYFVQLEAPLHFVKKSSSEMTQLAYHLSSNNDKTITHLDDL